MQTKNKIFSKTFFWMFLGLLATAIVAFYTYSSDLYENMIAQPRSLVMLAVIELVVVIVLSFCFRKLPATLVEILYFVYAILNGFTFANIFAYYEISSIGITFLLTAVFFGILALIGITTNLDISKWGTILFVALIVGLIASIINIFVGNPFIDTILDWIFLAIFAGYTIYDMRNLSLIAEDPSLQQDKIYIYFAMNLYLDFINLFLRLLQFFGKRDNS